MYDIIIVGGGIAGLNLARLLTEKNKQRKILILEKTNRIGGLIHSKFINTNDKQNKKKVKIEAGGAVIYSYQKNMLALTKKYNIDLFSLPTDNKGRHHKDFWDGKPRKKPLDKRSVDKYFKLIKKVFQYIEKKGEKYCNRFTLEQICLECLSFEETRFIEFCYGYAAEFRVTNANIAKKNIENELFNSDKIYFFKKGYSYLIKCLLNSIKQSTTIIKNCTVTDFKTNKNIVEVKANHKHFYCKQLVFAIPQQSLLSLCNSFTNKEIELLNKVKPISLNRIFVQYDLSKPQNKWLTKLNFSTVDNPIRQIIPARKNLGLFQISYSDWYFADYWGSLNKQNSLKLIKKLLSETFYHNKIDNPILYKKYYWKDAIHFWKPNSQPKQNAKKIQHLRKNVFIIGESFSLNQGWCEGAIQTSIQVAKLIK